MKRLLLAAAGILAGCLASAQTIHDLDITARLMPDGSARITQVWNITVVDGTEWYVPVSNLGEMTVTDFSVSEDGHEFINEGRRWDTQRNALAKKGRCGIVEKKHNDVELCWGHGGSGTHVFTASFTVNGLVKSYGEKDGFNYMFVNKGLAGRPQHVKVTIENGTSTPWTEENVLFWGFGCEGDVVFRDGKIVAETTEPFVYESSMILLCGFDKGIFTPALQEDKSFDELKEEAFSGSAYENWEENGGDNDPMGWVAVFGVLAAFFGSIVAAIRRAYLKATGRIYKKSVYGVDKITGWYREVPYGGDLLATFSTLKRGNRLINLKDSSQDKLISAYFLRWIQDGVIQVRSEGPGAKKVDLYFPEIEHDFDGKTEQELYSMALAASGKNRILESREFENWSKKHPSRVMSWPKTAEAEGLTKSISAGQEKARQAIEFKNFLNDFTLTSEREAVEVGLWKDYMVFAALFGIAEKVASSFKKLYPAQFEEYTRSTGMYTYNQMLYTLNFTDRLGASMLSGASKSYYSSSTIGGHGGHMSFGGGGGFSGGGFGGGSR